MIRTIFSSICGALILIAALTPTAILIMDKSEYRGRLVLPVFTFRAAVQKDALEKKKWIRRSQPWLHIEYPYIPEGPTQT